jgi:aminoglycoside phosphotransferase family enzyme/predicted kinase
MSAQPTLVRALMQPEVYPHPCGEIRLVETHISYIFLTGDYAYKMKKPLNLGFLNFSELEKREFFCHEEVRLNSRTAPDIYLGVVSIGGSPAHPVMNGSGEAFEYAVRMKQFPEEGLLDRQLREGALTAEKVVELAERAAELHEKIAVSGEADVFGSPDCVSIWALENFQQLEAKLRGAERLARLSGLKNWTEDWIEEHRELLQARKDGGFVRECHGDLHLGNITEIKGEVVLFDGIEFNDEIRWIDVINEMAFLFSDFEHRGAEGLGWVALNRYLEMTGDYAGLELFAFYRLYRLMVRAKIDSLRLAQVGLDQAEREELESEVEIYLKQGEAVTALGKPTLVLMRGLSGSGKSYISSRLIGELQAVRIRSDLERKRLYQVAELGRSGSEVGEGIYSVEASRKTFEEVERLTRTVLSAGYHTIVDATFLKTDLVQRFRAVAATCGVQVRILDVRAPEKLLRERLSLRAEKGRDVSEADQSVLTEQLKKYEELDGPDVIVVDGVSPPSPAELSRLLS